MITGGTLPTYPRFEVLASQPIEPTRTELVDRGDYYDRQTISNQSDRVSYSSDLPFGVVQSSGNVRGKSVTGSGLAVTEFRSALGQTRTHATVLVPPTITTEFDSVKPDSLAVATGQSYDPDGNTDTFDRDNNLLPGVDLTCIGVRNALAITPGEIVQAWHTRSGIGRAVTFIDRNGDEHHRTISAISEQLGDDLVIQRLNEDLPDTVTPAKVFPADVESYFSNATREYTCGFVSVRSINLSAGKFRFHSGVWDLDQSNKEEWREGVGGDSGSSCFVVIDGQVVAQGGLWNTAEQCTAIHNHLDAIQAFCSHPLSIIDLSEYPRVN